MHGDAACKVKAVGLIKERRGFIRGIWREAQGKHKPPRKYERVSACNYWVFISLTVHFNWLTCGFSVTPLDENFYKMLDNKLGTREVAIERWAERKKSQIITFNDF